MDEKAEFQQQNGKEVNKEEEEYLGQPQDSPPKKVNICNKPGRSGSFVRNWGGWIKGDE